MRRLIGGNWPFEHRSPPWLWLYSWPRRLSRRYRQFPLGERRQCPGDNLHQHHRSRTRSSLLEGRRFFQLSYANSPDSKDFAPSRFLPKLLIQTTDGRGADSRYISQAPSHRSRFTEPAASPAPRIDDVRGASIGAGVAGWLMTAIADDAHLSRPLLPATSSAIFVNN